jgi:hypothetical protein
LLDFYADILVAVNGVGAVDEVQQRALAALKGAADGAVARNTGT